MFVEGPDNEQLGYALAAANDSIFVGNPYVNNNEGNVRQITYENGSLKLSEPLITGYPNSEFGYKVKYCNDLLIVSSPAFVKDNKKVGRVDLYKNLQPWASYTGEFDQSGFGESITCLNNQLYIGAPNYAYPSLAW